MHVAILRALEEAILRYLYAWFSLKTPLKIALVTILGSYQQRQPTSVRTSHQDGLPSTAHRTSGEEVRFFRITRV